MNGERFFKSTNLRMEKNAIASIIAFDSKPGDIVSGYVFFEVPTNHGAWKSISYEDGSRDVTITLSDHHAIRIKRNSVFLQPIP